MLEDGVESLDTDMHSPQDDRFVSNSASSSGNKSKGGHQNMFAINNFEPDALNFEDNREL